MAFASDPGVSQSGGGGKCRRGDTEKPVVPARRRGVALVSLYVLNANTVLNLLFSLALCRPGLSPSLCLFEALQDIQHQHLIMSLFRCWSLFHLCLNMV